MKNLPKIFINLQISEYWGRCQTRGVVKYATIHGPWMFYRPPPFYVDFPKKPQKLIEWCREFQLDGIIMAGTIRDIKEFETLGIPMIFAGRKEDQYSSFANLISTDNAAIGRMAAKHLLKCGYNFFAFCGDGLNWSHQRCDAFVQTIEEVGYKVQIYKQPRSAKKRSWMFEQFILADWLKSLAKPVGLMTCSDNRSLEVVEACKIAEIDIPTDVAILGVGDDDLFCNLSPQPLSSVAVSSEQSGYAAAELMDKMLKGKAKKTGQTITIHPTHVVQRQSTDMLAIDDKEIAEAIYYIRDNPKKLLQVDDVAEQANMSRRTLQNKFRDAIGLSVYDEIENVRTEYMAKLLRDTNMSISQIALTMGYSGPENISRLFRKVKGMTATQYRKQFGRH